MLIHALGRMCSGRMQSSVYPNWVGLILVALSSILVD